MEQMSKFLNKLEWYPNIETSIIRSTKIHKVLKCILKLDGIPKESEFQFKSRSRTLLEMWNKVLGSGDQSTTSRPTLVYSEQPATPVPIQTSSETIPPPVETQVEVIGDWVLVIHAEEGNVVMEEDALNVA
jgi:hypothetical protein